MKDRFYAGQFLKCNKNGDQFDVKLKFHRKHAMFADEYRYDKNQISVTMQYRDDIVGFVINHQEFCEVLEPEWLKDEVLTVSRKLVEKYSRLI